MKPKLLILLSWYISPDDRINGSFFQAQGRRASEASDTRVIFPQSKIRPSIKKSIINPFCFPEGMARFCGASRWIGLSQLTLAQPSKAHTANIMLSLVALFAQDERRTTLRRHVRAICDSPVLQPAAPTISLGQQVALTGDEGLAQTLAEAFRKQPYYHPGCDI